MNYFTELLFHYVVKRSFYTYICSVLLLFQLGQLKKWIEESVVLWGDYCCNHQFEPCRLSILVHFQFPKISKQFIWMYLILVTIIDHREQVWKVSLSHMLSIPTASLMTFFCFQSLIVMPRYRKWLIFCRLRATIQCSTKVSDYGLFVFEVVFTT